jgi:hypothetical protein
MCALVSYKIDESKMITGSNDCLHCQKFPIQFASLKNESALVLSVGLWVKYFGPLSTLERNRSRGIGGIL